MHLGGHQYHIPHLFRSKFGSSLAQVRSALALAATQGVLKLCTFNVGCKEDDLYPKKWPDFKADLLKSFTRIQEHANMVCLQEVAKKVWDATQKFGIMWNPEVTVCVCVCACFCVCVCLYLYVCLSTRDA